MNPADDHILAELERRLEQGDGKWIATNHPEIIAILFQRCAALQKQLDNDYWPQA